MFDSSCTILRGRSVPRFRCCVEIRCLHEANGLHPLSEAILMALQEWVVRLPQGDFARGTQLHAGSYAMRRNSRRVLPAIWIMTGSLIPLKRERETRVETNQNEGRSMELGRSEESEGKGGKTCVGSAGAGSAAASASQSGYGMKLFESCPMCISAILSNLANSWFCCTSSRNDLSRQNGHRNLPA